MSVSKETKEAIERANKLNKIRDEWFNLFGYEKDINERINYELDRCFEVTKTEEESETQEQEVDRLDYIEAFREEFEELLKEEGFKDNWGSDNKRGYTEYDFIVWAKDVFETSTLEDLERYKRQYK